ncbi:MAG: DUF4339 domain-containing protein, partial [Actinomycetes bacterium]
MPTANDPIRWVDRQGQQIGPETLDLVLQRVHAGQISPATLVWWEGAAEWVPLWQVEGVDLPAPPGAKAAPHPVAA